MNIYVSTDDQIIDFRNVSQLERCFIIQASEGRFIIDINGTVAPFECWPLNAAPIILVRITSILFINFSPRSIPTSPMGKLMRNLHVDADKMLAYYRVDGIFVIIH